MFVALLAPEVPTVNVPFNVVKPETVSPANDAFPAVKVPDVTKFPPFNVKSWLTTTLFRVVAPVTLIL